MTSPFSLSRGRALELALANLIRIGTVASIAAGVATVTVGAITTVQVPWATRRAGDDSDWWSLSVGEQVVLLCPGGQLNQAIILCSLYQTANPPPATNPNQRVISFADGTTITYDKATHAYTLSVQGTGATVNVTTPGAINLTASGKVTISGSEIDLNGPVVASSTVSAVGDVTAAGVSLDNHKHTGVQAGSAISGPPQPA